MGTKRYSETPLPGYYIMRDLNEDSSFGNWPLSYGDKTVTNGYCCNGANSGEDMHSLKQKIVEHEAVFKNQVCELHRLYNIQRDMMERVQKNELLKERASVEPSCSSNIHGSQLEGDARKTWHVSGFPLRETSHNKASILGVEVTDSPVNGTKQDKDTKPPWFPFKNGSTSRNCEALEITRPSKVRKKFFDLQLPADEYVDVEEGEEITKQRMPMFSAYVPNENPKPFDGNCSVGKRNLTENGKASSHSRSFFGLFDLNEPVKNGVDDSNSNGQGGFLMKLHSETKVGEKGWLSHINEAGSSKSNIDSVSQSYHLYKMHSSSSSTTVLQASPSHLHFGPDQYRTGNGTRDFRADMHHLGLKSVDRNQFLSCGNNSKPAAHWPPGSYSLLNSSKHPLPNSQNEEVKWQQVKANNPRLNGGCFDYLSCNRNRHEASNQFTNTASGKTFCGSSRADSKAVFVEDRNAVAKNNGFKDGQSPLPWLKPKPIYRTTEAGESRRFEISGQSSYFHASSKHLCSKSERVEDLNNPGSSDCEILTKNETVKSVPKLMGAPIFGAVVPEIKPLIDINQECGPDETIRAEEPIAENANKNKSGSSIRDSFDLNSCVSDFEDLPLNHGNKCTEARIMIDLEAPAPMESEEEGVDALIPEEKKSDKTEYEDMQIQNEALKAAADIMLAISSSSCPQSNNAAETILENPLLLFADAIDKSLHRDSSEVDSFEAMTLQLKETKEEDYTMPKNNSFTTTQEEVEIVKLPNRPRRGGRGRQRKDFQRDVLPGMTSLSRHEVTEDIQTFGGLMKATGHQWHSRRKNGGARGGRGLRGSTVAVRNNPICTRSMGHQGKISEGDGCKEEERSLTGWGRTTRRPRRQRCTQMRNLAAAVVRT